MFDLFYSIQKHNVDNSEMESSDKGFGVVKFVSLTDLHWFPVNLIVIVLNLL